MGGGGLLMYYAAGGYVLENVHTDMYGWSLLNQKTIVNPRGTVSASEQGPVVATSYYVNNTYTRQVFFTNTEGAIYTTTSKDFSLANAITWNPPMKVSSDILASVQGTGLAVCVDNATDGLDGMRLYYGSGSGILQELQYSFARPASGWTQGRNWTEADYTSGVDCIINDASSSISVFWRNAKTGSIQQAVQNFGIAAGNRPNGELV
jgi:hypothetical protein